MNPYEHDESAPQMIPFGLTYSDQSTRVLWAPSLPEAEDQANADLRAATDPWGPSGWPTGMYGKALTVVSIEELTPEEATRWPDPPPDQVGTDPEDAAYELWKETTR